MSDDKKTFDDFVGTDIDKEVDKFVESLFDEDEPAEVPESFQEGLKEAESGNETELDTALAQSPEDPYEEQFQFFMGSLDEKLKPSVLSFLFVDEKDFAKFSIETPFKKNGKGLERCQQAMQKCFDGKFWNGKPIVVEAIKQCAQ